MIFWLFVIFFSIILGFLVSLIKYRFSWLIIILTPIVIISSLNNYYSDFPQNGAAMESAAYLFIGVPSIVIAFLSFLLMQYLKRRLR